MGLFDRLFKSTPAAKRIPLITLGRYSDSYKPAANYAAWSRSLALFEQSKYLESYLEFFQYLRDEEEDNVDFTLENNELHFKFYQGSRIIEGKADLHKLRVEAKIAYSNDLNVGFMRRLAEKNFSLKYSRFALDPDNNISIIFDTFTLDGSPYKLYFALKEVAINADKLDDLLVDEFKILHQIANTRLLDLPHTQKEIKYQFIKDQIEYTLNLLHTGPLHREQYPSAYTYLLLNLIYKLDYLTQPEGYMMETLERMHRLYFSNDGKSTIEKNQVLMRELNKLLVRPKLDFFKEMYRVSFTFGITSPVQHDQIIRFIDTELYNMDWYLEHGHLDIALSIPGYIVGYSLFNYAPPKPIRDLLQLYFAICEPDYFKALGFDLAFYTPEAHAFNRKQVRKAIEQITEENKSRYPQLAIPVDSLSFDSIPAFIRSYLWMIRLIDPTTVQGSIFSVEA